MCWQALDPGRALFSLTSLNLASVPITPHDQLSLMTIISSFFKKRSLFFLLSLRSVSLSCILVRTSKAMLQEQTTPEFQQQRFISFLHHMSTTCQLGLCSALSSFWDPSTLNGRCLALAGCHGGGGGAVSSGGLHTVIKYFRKCYISTYNSLAT